MQELKDKPYVSSKSNKIVEKMRQENKTIKDPMSRLANYQKKAQEKLKSRKKIREEEELEECTGKPRLSEKSRAMFNDVTKLIDWEKRQVEKQENERKKMVGVGVSVERGGGEEAEGGNCTVEHVQGQSDVPGKRLQRRENRKHTHPKRQRVR